MDALENLTFDEINIGDFRSFSKTLTESDLILFATVSGDVNPVHLDNEFAEKSIFKERIAHGMWSASLISATLATVIPGPGTIYLNQSLSFRRPVKLNETLTVTLTAKSKNTDKKTIIFDCLVKNQDDKTVVSGDAEVIAPSDKVCLDKPVLPEINIQDQTAA